MDCIFVRLTGREFQSWIADGTNELSKLTIRRERLKQSLWLKRL